MVIVTITSVRPSSSVQFFRDSTDAFEKLMDSALSSGDLIGYSVTDTELTRVVEFEWKSQDAFLACTEAPATLLSKTVRENYNMQNGIATRSSVQEA
jgi:hypothetical protein